MNGNKKVFKTYEFVSVIIRNFDGKWLAVNKAKNKGWQVPGGGVQLNESFIEAAHRETHKKSGIQILIKGVLKVEHSVF